MGDNQKDKVNCFQCIHFATTWEPKHPRSCKFFGFKTAQLPSVDVEKSSGATCEAFEKKAKKK